MAGQASRGYLTLVAAALFRLLAIAAIILMPIGMGMAPAAAAPTSHASTSRQKPDSEPGKTMAMHFGLDLLAQ